MQDNTARIMPRLGATNLQGFADRVGNGGLQAAAIQTVQVNIGLTCNLSCHHCHVSSSPYRKETLDKSTMEAILRLVDTVGARSVDITGGAPEMQPLFREFAESLFSRNVEIIVRTNLAILNEPGYEDFPDFFRDRRIHLVASLPCYLEINVDKQRGEGVYHGSIEAIKKLNAVGYGVDPHLALDLVYNPDGATLPPPQAALEAEYRRELNKRFGISFSNLYTITNVPIGRFQTDLRKAGKVDAYMDNLINVFNADTVEHLMCRHQISVGWDGSLYDCDFNLALGWKVGLPQKNIHDIDPHLLANRTIVTGDHCYACTAGCGSSCGGALV